MNYNESPLTRITRSLRIFSISLIYMLKMSLTRFGLNAFKVLGASYAVNQILLNRILMSLFFAQQQTEIMGELWLGQQKKYKKKCVVFVPKDTIRFTNKYYIKSWSE